MTTPIQLNQVASFAEELHNSGAQEEQVDTLSVMKNVGYGMYQLLPSEDMEPLQITFHHNKVYSGSDLAGSTLCFGPRGKHERVCQAVHRLQLSVQQLCLF